MRVEHWRGVGGWGRRALAAGSAAALLVTGLCGSMLFAATLADPPSHPAIGEPADGGSRYIRTIDDPENHRIVMQAAARTFVRDGKPGPTITMCAAVHIADRPFYEKLQALLDAKDVVLFESVKPAGTGRPEQDAPVTGKEADEHKQRTTKLRIRVLGIAAKAEKAKYGAYPKTLEELVAQLNPKMRPYVEGVTTDAWGHGLVYELKQEEDDAPAAAGGTGGGAGADAPKKAPREYVEVTSLGADGQPGGEGVNEDLHLTDQKPIKQSEIPRVDTKGLQSELADAFGLVFQLDAMTHDHPNWRNSDLSVDQVQDRIAGAGGDADQLFSMLDGSSMQAGLIKLVLGFVKMMPSVQLIGKVALMDMLARADELLDSVPGMEHMMDVIIKDRNQVVLDDLARIIETEKTIKTVGIIYGGGHMPDLEKHLGEMGYHESGVQWMDAISVDVPKDKQEAQQLQAMRQMVRDSLDQQVKMAAAAKKRAKKE